MKEVSCRSGKQWPSYIICNLYSLHGGGNEVSFLAQQDNMLITFKDLVDPSAEFLYAIRRDDSNLGRDQ
jgi:hypothetical protein